VDVANNTATEHRHDCRAVPQKYLTLVNGNTFKKSTNMMEVIIITNVIMGHEIM
jgi:hypothetical protein